MLGPEMKSTGECLGIATTFEDALLKGLIAAGYDLKKKAVSSFLFEIRISRKLFKLPINLQEWALNSMEPVEQQMF